AVAVRGLGGGPRCGAPLGLGLRRAGAPGQRWARPRLGRSTGDSYLQRQPHAVQDWSTGDSQGRVMEVLSTTTQSPVGDSDYRARTHDPWLLEVPQMSHVPSVTVVIPAHKRPVELRRAIAAVQGQQYAGSIDVVDVFDRAEPDLSLIDGGERPVRVLTNERTPGLTGARNTGILASAGELVAFCDDDDEWVPSKLSK